MQTAANAPLHPIKAFTAISIRVGKYVTCKAIFVCSKEVHVAILVIVLISGFLGKTNVAKYYKSTLALPIKGNNDLL